MNEPNEHGERIVYLWLALGGLAALALGAGLAWLAGQALKALGVY